ncbi:hypothetical protein Hanom_Chr15g01355401 [Helianthus anomalus]
MVVVVIVLVHEVIPNSGDGWIEVTDFGNHHGRTSYSNRWLMLLQRLLHYSKVSSLHIHVVNTYYNLVRIMDNYIA